MGTRWTPKFYCNNCTASREWGKERGIQLNVDLLVVNLLYLGLENKLINWVGYFSMILREGR